MFITFEGIEGSGKSTQIKHIYNFLKDCGYECEITKEPGGTRIGQDIRAILLNPVNKNLHPKAELLLYLADRIQHINEFIYPNLEQKKIVLCDRYIDATLVYQGIARGLGKDFILELHNLLFCNLKPDLTILFDLSPDIGLKRAKKQLKEGLRSNNEARFEEEAILFHEKVRLGYLDIASREPRFYIVNAEKDEISVKNEIIRIIKGFV